MTITPSDVRWAYQTFLARGPEDQEVILQWIKNVADIKQMIEMFISTDEYKTKVSLENTAGIATILYNKTKYGFWFPAPTQDLYILDQYTIKDYEAIECSVMTRVLRAGDSCIDLGARHGFMSCVMATCVGKDGVVQAFEPGAGTDVFQSAIDVNGFSNIKLYKMAAGNFTGKVRFSIETSQILTEISSSEAEVDIVRLDDVVDLRRPVAFIKADIEGAEFNALKGGENIIKKDKPIILIELFDKQQRQVSGKTTVELCNLLFSWGYEARSLSNRYISIADIEKMSQSKDVFNVTFVPVF